MAIYLVKTVNDQKVAQAVKTEAEFRALRNSEKNLKALDAARNGNKGAKARLVQFNYSGLFSEGGTIKNVCIPSDKFVLDIDNPEEFERVLKKVLNDPKRYGVLMIERSVNQGGHIVFRREYGKTILESQIAKARELGCEIDTNNHAINGVFFGTSASLDDLLYVHPDLFADDVDMEDAQREAAILQARMANGQEDVPQEAHGQKHYNPAAETSQNDLFGQATEIPFAEEGGREKLHPCTLEYMGIPYADIIQKWWDMFYDGQTPIKSNRDTRTYELAVNLRHICGFDAKVLDAVIPCYDGFTEQEKMKCINSALTAKMTLMPKRLKEVLLALRSENFGNEQFVQGMDELIERDDRYYYEMMPHGALNQGILDAINAVGPELIMPALLTSATCIGALATGVKVTLRKKAQHLNLWSFVVGTSGSGKGSMDQLVETWMTDIIAEKNEAHEKEKEWRKKKERLGSTQQEQPERPDLPVRYITLNNTIPNIGTRLENVKGKHCFSFTAELDTCTNKWRSSVGEFSAMGRQAYDGSAYARDARGAEAASVDIPELLWNVVGCGTPDALYRIINNYTDGLLSRAAIARTPDNTFSKLSDKVYVMTDKQRERIIQVARLLPLMQGTVELSKLEKHAMEWVEGIRLEAIKNNDAVFADSRKRDWVTAFRITVCLMLCRVCGLLIKKYGYEKAKEMLETDPELWQRKIRACQTADMMKAYDIIADSLIDNDMYYFRDRLEAAYNSKSYNGNDRQRRGKNDNIFARLDNTFTVEQAMQQTRAVKGESVTQNTVYCMLRNWIKQGLVIDNGNGTYTKVHGM